MTEARELMLEGLRNEVSRQQERISGLTIGTEEHTQANKELKELYLLIQQDVELQIKENEAIRKEEQERELFMIKEGNEVKHRKIQYILTSLGIVVPAGMSVWAILKSLAFEQDDIIITTAGKAAVGDAVKGGFKFAKNLFIK